MKVNRITKALLEYCYVNSSYYMLLTWNYLTSIFKMRVTSTKLKEKPPPNQRNEKQEENTIKKSWDLSFQVDTENIFWIPVEVFMKWDFTFPFYTFNNYEIEFLPMLGSSIYIHLTLLLWYISAFPYYCTWNFRHRSFGFF